MTVEPSDTLMISNVDALVLRDLRRAMPEGSITTAPSGLGSSQHGDLGTAAVVVVLGMAAIRALAAWLIKNRQEGRIDITRRTVRADRSVDTLKCSIDMSSSTSQAEVVSQLLAGLKIDSALLGGAATDESSPK